MNFPSTLLSTLTLFAALTSSAAIQRDTSFLPSAKERGPLVHSTGDVCKVGMGKMNMLPYDEELEYLESNGNQAVDTLYQPTSNDVTVNAWFSNLGNEDANLIGSYNEIWRGRSYPISIYYNNAFQGVPNENIGLNDGLAILDNSFVFVTSVCRSGNLSFSVNNIVRRTSSKTFGSLNNEVPWSIFARRYDEKKAWIDSEFAYRIKCRLKTLDIVEYGIKQRDYIAVIKNGVPCLYDKSTKSFFYNVMQGHQFGYKKKDGTIVAPY